MEEFLGWVLYGLSEILLYIGIGSIDHFIEFVICRIRKSVRRSPVNPWIGALVYFVLGVAGGFLSLWLFPKTFIKPAFGIDCFPFAALFAFGIALVRFRYG